MKVLVTGGAGFIGTHLCKALIERGWDVCVLDKKPQEPKDLRYTYYQADVRNMEPVKESLKGVDLIIHLAAGHHDFGISREEFFSVNEEGTKTLLKGADIQGVKKVIFTSTVAVYGTQNTPTTEKTPTTPDSDYGESKLAAERAVNDWVTGNSNRTAIIIRPTVVFGPHNFANIYNLIKIISRHRYLQVGKGDKVKSLAYVENLVAAILFLMDQNFSGCNVYNYADEPHLQTREFVEIICRNLGTSAPRVYLPYWVGISAGTVFDLIGAITKKNFPVTKARIKKTCTATHHLVKKLQEEGFKPVIHLEDGFEKTVSWLRSNHYI